ncbi:MAG: valine--tRNA ligase [Bacteroidales bacterium]
MEKDKLTAKYRPKDIEDKWYAYWLERKFFHSEPDGREPYCVVIPPPNVTGILHMGHMLNNTIQDVLVRRARMQGKNACWVPGMDHASIATEAKVVALLKERGIEKKSLTREAFLEHAWQWKEKYGGIILQQLQKLGASCDWERTRFTMDEGCSESVSDVFVNLYNKGLIYRGIRMVNWDPKALTALSDEEVIYKEVHGKLYYLRYPIVGEEGKSIVVATTRPETILGDTAICVHPEDTRFIGWKGVKVRVPLIDREIPIIQDEYVDREFGTACLKITPAHDINDYQLGLKYKLDSIDIFNDNGTINGKVGPYEGLDRFEARKEIVHDLKAAGLLEKEEDYTNKVGYSERTDVVIEPKLSVQWFLRMPDLAKPALEVVMNDTVAFYPPKFKNTYRYWMENVKDWCISRQLWWGHRIPAFYLPNREVVVAKTIEEALIEAKKKFPEEARNYSLSDLKQEEDVLDTWFSSWLWPIAVFDGIRKADNKEINYYYPICDLVTAPDIMFFWVARMIMAGLTYRKQVPFTHVYFTGTVRDKLGRKMSKSLGNSPDPIELIQNYGADGVRVGMLLTSPAGNDLPFEESLCEQGRNFCNKIWNALRLIESWQVSSAEQPNYALVAGNWFETKLNQTLLEIEDHYEKYRLSDVLMALYKLVWDDFCSWYLEMIKPAYEQPIDAVTHAQAVSFFDKLIKVLHPFMPFITEEIWHILEERKADASIMFEPTPKAGKVDEDLLSRFEFAKEVIISIRAIRNEKNIAHKIPLELSIKKGNEELIDLLFDELCCKLCNLEAIYYTKDSVEDAIPFVVGSTEFFVHLNEEVDVKAELEKVRKELEYTEGFLKSVEKKLSNGKFVESAPSAVVEGERKKQADAQHKLQVLKKQIAQWEKLCSEG